MWIDVVVIFFSLLLLFVLAFLGTKAKEEMELAIRFGEERNAKIYRACMILIHITALGLCGVLAYVYVFQ